MTNSKFLRIANNSPDFKPLDVDYQQCSLPGYFERIVSRYPFQLAITDDENSYTYEQANHKANQVAAYLLKKELTGRVAVYLPNCAEAAVYFLGILKAKCVAVMIDPGLPVEQTRYLLANSTTRLMLTSSDYFEQAKEISLSFCPVICTETEIEVFPTENVGLVITIDSPATLVYTSGSTGEPKGVLHSHRAWMASIGAVAQCEKYTPKDRIAQVYSPSSAASLIGIIYAILTGASVHMYDVNKHGLPNLLNWIEKEQITAFRMTGTAFRQVFSGKPCPEKMKQVRLAMIGGEMIHKKDWQIFKAWFPPTTLIRVGGGATEVLLIASCYLDHESIVDTGYMPMGYVLDPIKVEIWGEDNLPLPYGEVGEIIVRGPSVANGYWNRPEDQGGFISDPDDGSSCAYRMGDLGYLTDDGLLYIGGRKDRMVKVRGYRVELGAVEVYLEELPGISQGVVMAYPARDGSSQLVAYIVPDLENLPGIREIRSGLAKHLPEYMIPTRFVFLKQLPLNKTNKVDYQALPRPGNDRPDIGIPFEAPQTYIQKALVSIWSEVLGIEKIGIDDDFTLLGGDSLSATQIFIMIEEGLNTKLPPSILINAPTIRLLAEKLFNYRKGQEDSLVILRNAQEGYPTMFLFAPLFGDVIIFRDLLVAIPGEVGIVGLQSWTKDRKTYGEKSIDQMLDDFLPLIQQFQPTGPYYLGGFSLGGALAYQAAFRLKQIGADIGFVFMLDSNGPGVINKFDLQEYLYWFNQSSTMKEKIGFLQRGIIKVLRPFAIQFTKKKATLTTEKPGQQVKTKYVPYRVLQQPYSAPEMDVDLILFTADRGNVAKNTRRGNALGWEQVAKGELTVIQLSGNHEMHFRGENAKKIAEILVSALDGMKDCS